MKIDIKCLTVYLCIMLTVVSSSAKKRLTLAPTGYAKMQNLKVTAGNLKAVFVDNSPLAPIHRAGYNGIAELYHTEMDTNIFVPNYAGFNLEHIFSGDSLVQFFEPRVNPMALYKKSDTEALLYQQTTPISGVESLTEFKLTEPCYIDITFSCILHDKAYFGHQYAGFFWASYINRPSDLGIYFKGKAEGQTGDSWVAAYSARHGTKSTHRSTSDTYDFFFAPNFKATLANNYSDYRYSLPFYFGHFNKMALACFFKSSEVIRLSQSPSGGGKVNPAWDFQYLIPKPKTEKVYRFKARMVYKPFIANDDLLKEYLMWTK